jgi:hypothetical protein
MSLIPCSDCGREISALAPACIHCGRPMQAGAAPAPAPFAAGPECPLCAAPVTHPSARTGGKTWCERCGAQLIYGTDGALVRAVPREHAHIPAHAAALPLTMVNEDKNPGLAALLTIFFGPLGMAYSTVPGAITMCFISLFMAMATMGFGLFITWPVSVIWAVQAANEHNRRRFYAAAQH